MGGKKISLAVFCAVLALQVVIPLRYYLGASDHDDERFAWRMFSSTWLARRACDVSYEDVYEHRPAIDPSAEQRFDEVWLPVLRRRWDWATERIVAHRCRTRTGLRSIRIIERCGFNTVPVTHRCVGTHE